MEKTVIIQGEVDNVVIKDTKAGSKVYCYQIATYGEDGRKRLGDVRAYEDRGYKRGDVVVLMGFENSRIYKDKVYTDINLYKLDREAAKKEEMRKIFAGPEMDKEAKKSAAGGLKI